jgi:hypothetical protein
MWFSISIDEVVAAANPSNSSSGKEREGSEADYFDCFGARYFSSGQGRFTSPDEFKGVGPFTGLDIETNTAVPYADIFAIVLRARSLWPMARLVEVWNQLPGAKQIRNPSDGLLVANILVRRAQRCAAGSPPTIRKKVYSSMLFMDGL